MIGVSISTLRRWDQENILKPSWKTAGQHRRYHLALIREFLLKTPKTVFSPTKLSQVAQTVVIYSRVSSLRQKADLQRQITYLETFAKENAYLIRKKYQDIGSGLNDQRKGLLQLIKDLPVLQPSYVLCTYPDRLARFGLEILRTACLLFDTRIKILNYSKEAPSLETRLVQDVLAILTSFSGKLYRSRRGKHQSS